MPGRNITNATTLLTALNCNVVLNMPHDHSHHHHPVDPKTMNTAFVTGIILNVVFVIIEVIAGIWQGSMALLSDAGHNLADVGALALSLFAYKMVSKKSTEKYTYGYRWYHY